MKQDDIPLAPVTGWVIGPISAYAAVTLRLDYLTHPMQTIAEAHQTPQMVMTAAQAQELIAALQKAVLALGDGPPEGSGLPRH